MTRMDLDGLDRGMLMPFLFLSLFVFVNFSFSCLIWKTA